MSIQKANDLIVKDNSLVNACFDLTLVEYRLLNLAFSEITENNKSQKDFKISCRKYAEVYKVDEKSVYKQLKDARDKLFYREFLYKRKVFEGGISDTEYTKARWINKASYADKLGYIKFQITDDVLIMVSFLKQCFTRYRLSITANLGTIYSIRLYELIIKWESTGKTPVIPIEDFKNMLAIGSDKYSRVADFKIRILNPSIKQINEHTDIVVKVDDVKTGRAITGFIFSFKFKKEAIEGESKKVKPLTAKQVFMFSNKLSENKAFQSIFEPNIGEDYEEYAERIAQRLLDPKYIEEWHSYLVDVGYKA